MMPTFPGATQCSRVSLYGDLDTAVCGGTPHLHTACTEAYIWLEGAGSIELLHPFGHHLVATKPDDVVWFSPGVIHRGVPADDAVDAEVLVIMQNAGLPEAGDAVITLPERLWTDPSAYRSLVDVSAPTMAEGRALVRERRALAMEGLGELVAAVDRLGPSGLDGFYEYAASVVRPHLDAMAGVLADRVQTEVDRSSAHIAAMRDGSWSHLREASFVTAAASPAPVFGMCGDLRPVREEPGS